jgi:DNA polymerase III epsilon subunit-like protein
MTKFVFIDTETTSLRPDRRAWEIGLVLRAEGKADDERTWFVEEGDLDLGNADPFSLKIGRFYERHPQYRTDVEPVWNDTTEEVEALSAVEVLTRGAILVGAVPNFDAEVLGCRMRHHGILPSWHYHLVDVETLAAGAKKLTPPWDFDAVLELYGLTYDEKDRHTALGDARMARDLYDAILGEKSDAA